MPIQKRPISLPAGEYDVVPGNSAISPSPEVWALVEALHEERDLDAFGIHKITVKTGERQTFNFDFAALQEPIRKMMEAAEAKDE